MIEEKKQDLDLLINRISFDNGLSLGANNNKIVELRFVHSKIEYLAKINPSDIILEKNTKNSGLYVKMNKSDLKTFWNFRHCCGTSGFGHGIEDVCPACKSKGSLVEFDKNNKATFMIYAGYTDELYNILTHLPTYCTILESEINTTLKQLYSNVKI